uniref:poly(A)-specific ribonuclease n=1 Tax=Heterorhabditis bacteriophora TaxID=37862 RepID=A0A1I7XS20_HETBA
MYERNGIMFTMGTTAPDVRIHDVWHANVEEEFSKMRALIEHCFYDYPFVAMDTEFPGVVATPLGTFKSKEDFNYQQVSCNVNMLKLIQVGFALVNDKGELPPTGDVWQFNFHFSLNDDMYSQESVEMLRTAGIDFNRLQESQFFQFHRTLFPRCYDIKLLLRMPGCSNAKLKGGLQEISTIIKEFECGRMPSNSQRKHTISNKVRKRPGKDLDQIHEDLRPEKSAKLLNQEIIRIYAFLPARNKSIYSDYIEFWRPGTDEFFKDVLSSSFVVDYLLLQEVVGMRKKLVVGRKEVW